MNTLNSTDTNILLPSRKNVEATNADIFINISLETNSNPFNPDNLNRYFSSKSQFELERKNSFKYNISGKINFISLFNGFTSNELSIGAITSDPTKRITFADLIDGNIDNSINTLQEMFKPYLVYNHQNIDLNDGTFIRQFKILTSNIFVDICGYEQNVFGENVYQFIVNEPLDFKGLVDGFGLPLTEVYLYMHFTGVNQISQQDYISQSQKPISNALLKPTDIIYGDLVTFDNKLFQIKVLNDQSHTVLFPNILLKNLKSNAISYKNIQNIYDPFLKIPIKTFASSIEEAYTGDTICPSYSYVDNNGLATWRDVLDIGYVEPDTNIGFDFPFLNGEHHVFMPLTFKMDVDLKHLDSQFVFRNIIASSSKIMSKANSDIQTEQC